MTADYVHKEELRHILAALMPANRVAMEISLATGLRIGDVLALRTEQLGPGPGPARTTVREAKTGKARRVTIPADLAARARRGAGRVYVFPGRLAPDTRHRTRQAVYKDLRRAAVLYRVREHVSPHTARKTWAVEALRRHKGDLRRVQQLLGHEDEAVTLLYAMADVLTARRLGL